MTIEKFYAFAGLEFSVEVSKKDRLYLDDGQLTPFRVASATDPHRFRFRRAKELPAPRGEKAAEHPGIVVFRQGDTAMHYQGAVSEGWEAAYICSEHEDKDHRITILADSLPVGIGPKTLLKAIPVEHLIARNNGFVFHCSCITRNGRAILFTAPSEMGKSTQAELWKQFRGADIINGDRAVIRMAEGKLLAEGIPFSGSSPYCKNTSLPIEAIVYLGKAPETTIRRLTGLEAFLRIWEGISANTWDREDMELVSRTAQTVAEMVPVLHMCCTPDESAVTALEQALRKLVNR